MVTAGIDCPFSEPITSAKAREMIDDKDIDSSPTDFHQNNGYLDETRQVVVKRV